MGVIKLSPDTASLISACDMLDDMKVSAASCDNRNGVPPSTSSVLVKKFSFI